MKYLVILCCLLASTLAKDKKISLEDIERDNLRTQKVPSKVPASPTTFGFVPTKTASDYARQQPKYVQYVPPQQYTPAVQQYQQYYYQPQSQVQQQPQVQQPNLYQQYENIQYITDNSVAAQQQQYYTPQYVYLQQYTAPSTAVQSVVDPKAGIQYVMYVPASYAPKAEQTQNYESVVYATPQTYVVPQTQYVQSEQPEPSVKYVPETPKVQVTEQVYTKQEPKSLLDSYVPSILQVQYYKQQQQAQANAIQQSLKEVSSQVPGKSNYVKSSYRPTQHNSAESINHYTYQIPSTQ